MNMTIYSKLY